MNNTMENGCMNPFSEIRMLSGHTDIIRLLVIVDDIRCCSAGDDGLVIVWNTQTGLMLHKLNAHSRPVTSVCVVKVLDASRSDKGHCFLVTSSSDKFIHIWNLDAGICLKSFTSHSSAVKCLAVISSQGGVFCSGGEKLCLWSVDNGLIDSVSMEESIRLLLIMRKKFIIAAADNHIVIYRYSAESDGQKPNLVFQSVLSSHREVIQSLVQISKSCFVSGSLDGAIVQWSLDSTDAIDKYNYMEYYHGEHRNYPFSVQSLISLGEDHLACAIGSGFRIYNTRVSDLIVDMPNVHDSKVIDIQLIYEGRLLATCSVDGSIKLWGYTVHTTSQPLAHEEMTSQPHRVSSLNPTTEDVTERDDDIVPVTGPRLSVLSTRLQSMRESKANLSKNIPLVGECLAHSGPVNSCAALDGTGLISCGADKLVILWKDKLVVECKRDKFLRDILYQLSPPATLIPPPRNI